MRCAAPRTLCAEKRLAGSNAFHGETGTLCAEKLRKFFEQALNGGREVKVLLLCGADILDSMTKP
eukprot:3531068-Rhodomonas_salina.1